MLKGEFLLVAPMTEVEWEGLRKYIGEGIPNSIPQMPIDGEGVDRAPVRKQILSSDEKRLALKNALRYFPEAWHTTLAEEFLDELNTLGRIYMLRFRPTEYEMRAHPIAAYPAKCQQAAAIMLMIQNNLDKAVAQYPYELITYGGNGAVFQNWAQYRITMEYLSQMDESQTLVMYSGHPHGLFPSNTEAPRVIVSNGMVIPNYSSQDHYEKMNAQGVSQYGQMTAGSYMYIGPQGIVHGTTITLMNAARLKLGRSGENLMAGVTFVTSGLGGMSGAQAKAAVIAGAVGVIAEINPHAAHKRYEQGWLSELYEDIDQVLDRMEEARDANEAVSIGYIGNVVDLWKRIDERNIHIDLGSDQTSLHNPWQGGYYPAGLSFIEAQEMMAQQPIKFAERVKSSLVEHASVINRLAKKGMYFWDYGNAFLLEASRAGADVMQVDGSFKYPSYVQDIMGPMCFDYGFGPFRWVCTSGDEVDLEKTDRIASSVLSELAQNSPDEIRQQMWDNIRWINGAGKNKMVVGSQARILYADAIGRRSIAQAFNEAIESGHISEPIVLGRDHHDVSGTDSPYRETANIYDGSAFTADMAIHNVIGDSFRGATWVSIHNGGGVGWGEAINGGFGMVLDGSKECSNRLHSMLSWDVNNGVARRAWARNSGAEFAIIQAMQFEPKLSITLPNHVAESMFLGLDFEGTNNRGE